MALSPCRFWGPEKNNLMTKNSPQTLLKRHYEKMAELERLEKRMAELLRELQDNMEKLERLGVRAGRSRQK